MSITYARFPNTLVTHIVTPDGRRLECNARHTSTRPWQRLTEAGAAKLTYSDVCGTCRNSRNARMSNPRAGGNEWRNNPITALQVKVLTTRAGYAEADIAGWTQGKAADAIDKIGERLAARDDNRIY